MEKIFRRAVTEAGKMALVAPVVLVFNENVEAVWLNFVGLVWLGGLTVMSRRLARRACPT